MKFLNRIGLIVLWLPLISHAQYKGIQWASDLSWEQVKQKAKIENKYIFLDCFATWCGPCKGMDSEIYSNDTIGTFFNDKFISVRVQMDKTAKDDLHIQSWYNSVASIGKEYFISGYPTFIFLSPDGTIVNREQGYKSVNDFLSIAKESVMPGRKYNNEFEVFNQLIKAYRGGERDFKSYPLMIKVAFKVGDTVWMTLLRELTDFVETLNRESRYDRDRIETWDQFTFKSNSKLLNMLRSNEGIVNKIIKNEKRRGNLKGLMMTKEGWVASMVDRAIMIDIIDPFFNEQNKDKSIVLSGGYLSGSDLKSNYNEANWKQLENLIHLKYNIATAKRNVLIAQLEWYDRHRNYKAYIDRGLKYLNKYCAIESENPFKINGMAWKTFLYSNDKKTIQGYIGWMKKVLQMKPNRIDIIDTYANLLYKSGKVKDAILWEERAANLSGGERYRKIINKMERGEATYVERGAVWSGKM